jgi:hypothetical protein
VKSSIGNDPNEKQYGKSLPRAHPDINLLTHPRSGVATDTLKTDMFKSAAIGCDKTRVGQGSTRLLPGLRYEVIEKEKDLVTFVN